MRRLTTDELLLVATELAAVPLRDVPSLESIQETGEGVVGAMAHLLVAIVGGMPFDRRNGAIGIAAADLLGRLNRRRIDLEPPEGVVALLADVRAGLSVADVRAWLESRVFLVPPAACPRCPSCSMPLREAFAAQTAGAFVVPACAGCGHPLARPFRQRPLQEV